MFKHIYNTVIEPIKMKFLLLLVAAVSVLASNPLEDYFNGSPVRVIHKWVHYFDIYHRYFEKYRTLATPTNKVVFLEIGLYQGGSLDMWLDYFGPDNCIIYGIDIDQRMAVLNTSQTRVFIGDQADPNFLNNLKNIIPQPDIILDDGGHTMNQQRTSFEHLFNHLKPGGVYMVEDTHTSYWSRYGGGYKNPQSFIEYSKGFVDQLHNYHAGSEITLHQHSLMIDAVHYHDSIVVFDKTTSPRSRPYDTYRGYVKIV